MVTCWIEKSKMPVKHLLAFYFLFIVCWCFTCGASTDSCTSFAKEALSKYVDSGELPGAISVFYDKGVQETCLIGYADLAKKRPLSLDSLYMQCSQTKGFCGVTVAKLIEEGKLNLDDPVSRYLPEFKALWVQTSSSNCVRTLALAKNILTVRMCLNHTGGFGFDLPQYELMGGWSHRMPLRSVAVMAAQLPLEFEPGTKVRYSNVGIDIGAAVVEVVTGMRWEDYLKKNIFDPLGMTNSTFRPTDEQLASKMELYRVAGGKEPEWMACNAPMALPYNDDRIFPSAGAGLWTTANDQLKFYKMLMNLGLGENGTRILKEETVKNLLATPTRPAGICNAQGHVDELYSLGLWVRRGGTDDGWFGHGGAWHTVCSVNWRKCQLKLWAVQQLGEDRPWEKARDAAAEAFFKVKMDDSESKDYTGRMD